MGKNRDFEDRIERLEKLLEKNTELVRNLSEKNSSSDNSKKFSDSEKDTNEINLMKRSLENHGVIKAMQII